MQNDLCSKLIFGTVTLGKNIIINAEQNRTIIILYGISGPTTNKHILQVMVNQLPIFTTNPYKIIKFDQNNNIKTYWQLLELYAYNITKKNNK